MEAQRNEAGERKLSPVSRRAFLTAAPAAAAGAALLGACGGGGYADVVVYADGYADVYANCTYCDAFVGGVLYDYTCCDGRFVCDGLCYA